MGYDGVITLPMLALFIKQAIDLCLLCVFSVQFSNLCGAVYKQGRVVFSHDGNSVLSPVGNRISKFDLKK